MNDRGDIFIPILLLAGAILTAASIAPVLNVGDSVANRFVVYGAAAGVALGVWRKIVRPILGIAEHVQRIPQIDERVQAIDERVQAIDERVDRIEQRLVN